MFFVKRIVTLYDIEGSFIINSQNFYQMVKQNIKKWEKFYTDIGLDENIYSVYLDYISELNQHNIPAIFEFNHLAQLLGRSPAYLASAINSTENHYRQFEIPKRNGGQRVILAPFPALLECQKWIKNNILESIKTHEICHGFKKNKSIITNANRHLNKKCLLKLDLLDFFPSININRVIKVFKNIGYPNNISFYLAKLCCYENKLPQGASTSPILSNIILYYMDCRLKGLANSQSLECTRYADDIVFSGEYISHKIINIVESIVTDCGFKLNATKTKLSIKTGKKIVTGISVGGTSIKIPRQYKRKLRQEIYHILSKGFTSHISKRKIRNPYYLNSIYGKFNFWKQVEPNNQFVKKVEKQLYELLKS